MRVKEISISKGMTVHIGNRQYSKAEVGMTADLDVTDDYGESVEALTRLVDSKLAQEVEKVLPKRQVLMEERPSKSHKEVL